MRDYGRFGYTSPDLGGRPRYVVKPQGVRVLRYPKVGRFRLYTRAGSRWRCRACGEAVQHSYQWPHLATEISRAGSEAALVEILAAKALRSRKDHYRREAQRYHEKAAEAGLDVDPPRGR